MKIFKFCLLPVVLLVATVFVVGLFCPEYWEVQVSTEIAATSQEIHPWVEDLHRWEEWTHGAATGAEFEVTYEGAERGVGAIAHSKGTGSDVRWEITSSNPETGVWFNEVLQGSVSARGAIQYKARGDATLVTWTDRGTLGDSSVFRLANLFMQSTLTKAFQRNLEELRERVEAASPR
jgi:hypothetical protein